MILRFSRIRSITDKCKPPTPPKLPTQELLDTVRICVRLSSRIQFSKTIWSIKRAILWRITKKNRMQEGSKLSLVKQTPNFKSNKSNLPSSREIRFTNPCPPKKWKRPRTTPSSKIWIGRAIMLVRGRRIKGRTRLINRSLSKCKTPNKKTVQTKPYTKAKEWLPTPEASRAAQMRESIRLIIGGCRLSRSQK